MLPAALLTGCFSNRQIASSSGTRERKTGTKELRFLDNISLNSSSGGRHEVRNPSSDYQVGSVATPAAFQIEDGNILQFKYAIRLDTEVERLYNTVLYEYIDQWWAVPYSYGGTTRKGVDCSGFVQNIFAATYRIQLPRTTREQRDITVPVNTTELKEGDLLFYDTRGGVSHVGIYLQNNKFVHASTSGGVMISDMSEPYWSRRFLGAGRVPEQLSAKK